MNAIKRFESKKRLVEKLKEKAKNYRWAIYNNHSFFGDTAEVERTLSHYAKCAKECDKHIRGIENSYTYKLQKDYAKNRRRKGGR